MIRYNDINFLLTYDYSPAIRRELISIAAQAAIVADEEERREAAQIMAALYRRLEALDDPVIQRLEVLAQEWGSARITLALLKGELALEPGECRACGLIFEPKAGPHFHAGFCFRPTGGEEPGLSGWDHYGALLRLRPGLIDIRTVSGRRFLCNSVFDGIVIDPVKVRRRLEDRLRKDPDFLWEVAEFAKVRLD